jgi:hypothetical protein
VMMVEPMTMAPAADPVLASWALSDTKVFLFWIGAGEVAGPGRGGTGSGPAGLRGLPEAAERGGRAGGDEDRGDEEAAAAGGWGGVVAGAVGQLLAGVAAAVVLGACPYAAERVRHQAPPTRER